MHAEPRIGEVIADKYVLHERIGAGGMGVVYRAAQPALSRTVAIKLLHRTLAGDPELVRRFHDEAIAASRVSHPSSVAVFDWGQTRDGTPFIVMEDVRGTNLGRLVSRDGLLPLPRVVAVVRQILAALGEAHRADVVHGDVKTDNILVEATPAGDRIRLIDYGLARFRDRADRDQPRRDAAGHAEVAGTPDYMAPEVIHGDAPVPASDLYGAGVILYELLVGATPFGGGKADEVMKRHVVDEVVPPSLRRPERGISTALERVVLRAMAKRPEARFADAAAFSAALAEAELVAAPGATRDRVDDAAEPDRPTRNWGVPEPTAGLPSRPARFPLGSSELGTAPRDREGRLRQVIGEAIAGGDVTAIAASYLALARALASQRRLAAAVRELEEAIDVITAGSGPASAPADARVAGLVDELAVVRRKQPKRGPRGHRREHVHGLPATR